MYTHSYTYLQIDTSLLDPFITCGVLQANHLFQVLCLSGVCGMCGCVCDVSNLTWTFGEKTLIA